MTSAITIPARSRRLPVDDSATHLFRLGQAVRLRTGLSPSSIIYRITAKLPPSGEEPQYHIRSDAEKFERMATQANLELVSLGAGVEGEALVKKPLDLGLWAYLQPSPVRNSEARNGPIRARSRFRHAERVERTPNSSRTKT